MAVESYKSEGDHMIPCAAAFPFHRLLQDVTPPLAWRVVRRVTHGRKSTEVGSDKYAYGEEQPAEFYDERFFDHMRCHYVASRYYPIWTVILDRLRKSDPGRILDLGCGSGQFAMMLRDSGFTDYLGVDFSKKRIEFARRSCPGQRFIVADIFDDDVLSQERYGTVTALEVLEHVDGDLQLLARLRSNVRVIASVPNYPAFGHVRVFQSTEQVQQRYCKCFRQLDVVEIPYGSSEKKIFLMDGLC